MVLTNNLIKPCRGCNYRTERTWDEFIDSVVFAYNTSCYESSCYAPFEVMFGHKAVLPIDVDLKSVSRYCGKLSSSPLHT